MIVNMMIELELECLVSRQWQEQIRDFSGRSRFADFSRESRPGAAEKKSLGAGINRNIRLYSSTNISYRVITLYML